MSDYDVDVAVCQHLGCHFFGDLSHCIHLLLSVLFMCVFCECIMALGPSGRGSTMSGADTGRHRH